MTIPWENCVICSTAKLVDFTCPVHKIVTPRIFGVGSSNFDSTQVLDRTFTNLNGFGITLMQTIFSWSEIIIFVLNIEMSLITLRKCLHGVFVVCLTQGKRFRTHTVIK